MTGIRPTRRHVLRGAAVGAAGLLSGCGAGSSTEDTDNPFGVDPRAALEVVVVSGPFGEAPARAHEARYMKRYPKADIRHSAAQDVGKSLRRRFAAGTPPDVVQNSGAGAVDLDVIEPADLGPLLDAPSLDVSGRTVRQTLRPGTVQSGAVNYAYTVYGGWHSGRLLAERGWPAPRTWDEHIALCRRIRAAGIVPWTYDGRQPYEMSWAMLATAVKAGGRPVAEAIDTLEPNAWLSAAMRSATEAWHQVVRDGFVQPGSAADFGAGRAAFRSGGSWLEHSVRDVVPPGFRLAVAPVPGLGAGDALPYEAVRVTPEEPFVVPAKATNRAGGLEFLRVMLSRAGAADFTTAVSSLTAVAGEVDGLASRPGLESAVGALDAAGDRTFTLAYPQHFPALECAVVGAACGQFFAGEIGPADFLARCQKGADEIARGG